MKSHNDKQLIKDLILSEVLFKSAIWVPRLETVLEIIELIQLIIEYL